MKKLLASLGWILFCQLIALIINASYHYAFNTTAVISHLFGLGVACFILIVNSKPTEPIND